MRLLVVEDDKDLNRQIVASLEQAGYAVDRAFDGEEGLFLGETEPYDAVVLDLGLPTIDGVSVLQAWRRAGKVMPILILTARDRWKRQGFRLRRRGRRLCREAVPCRGAAGPVAGAAAARLGPCHQRTDLRAAAAGYALQPRGRRWHADQAHLARVPAAVLPDASSGRVVSRSELVEHLYDQDFDRDSNTIEVFIGRLRRKLDVEVIQTVRGLGYMVAPPAG